MLTQTQMLMHTLCVNRALPCVATYVNPLTALAFFFFNWLSPHYTYDHFSIKSHQAMILRGIFIILRSILGVILREFTRIYEHLQIPIPIQINITICMFMLIVLFAKKNQKPRNCIKIAPLLFSSGFNFNIRDNS